MKILPYASYSEPTTAYPDELEAAVTLLGIESKRSKGRTAFLVQKAAEDIAWISRFVWPMLALPVTFPAVPGLDEAGPDGLGEAQETRRVLLFDLTGLTSSSIAAFRLREDLDLPAQLVSGEDLTASAATTILERRTAALRESPRSIQGAITAVRGLVRRDAGNEAITGFVSAQAQLARDIIGHLGEPVDKEWSGPEIARSIETGEVARVAEEIASRIEAYLSQAAKIEDLAAKLNDLAATYPPELAEQRSEIKATYDVQLDVIRPDVEQAIASHQHALEDRLIAITQQYSGSAAAQEAEASKADRDVERFRSLGKEYEGQLAEARRTKQEAQRRLDATNRERDNATKQARNHFRGLIDEENDKLNALIKARDQELARLTETEHKLDTALSEFRGVAIKAAQQDRKYAAELVELALPTTAVDSPEPLEFGVPYYVARLDGSKTRYIALAPITIKRGKGLTQHVSGLMGGLTLPSEPRSQRYESILGKALAEAVESSAPAEPAAAAVAASINEKAASADVLGNPHFRDLALAGLDSLKAGRWITNDRRYEEQKQAILRMYGVAAEPKGG